MTKSNPENNMMSCKSELCIEMLREIKKCDLFIDKLYQAYELDAIEEALFSGVFFSGLQEAKEKFEKLSTKRKCSLYRYVFSHRGLCSERMNDNDRQIMLKKWLESIGTLYTKKDLANDVIQVENAILTRILYISEDTDLNTLEEMKNELVKYYKEYEIILKAVIDHSMFHQEKR